MWGKVVEFVGNLLDNPLLVVFFAFIGYWFRYWQEWLSWRQRQFLDRINFSLNTLQEGRLQIRTLAEMTLQEVFINPHMIRVVNQAAERTTQENPLLPFSDEDRWQMNNAVLNAVAELFQEGVIRRDMGLPVHSAWYVLALTRERAGEMKTHKIRVMIVREELLQNWPTTPPEFEQAHHALRHRTLTTMKQEYEKYPQKFLKVQLSVAVDANTLQSQTTSAVPTHADI